MHQHLTLAEYGQFLGVRGECLLVRDGDAEQEFALNRIKSIQIAKRGVSISSDAMLKCAARGIRLFVCDFRNREVATLSGVGQHAVVAVRRNQFQAIDTPLASYLAACMVNGKIRNQRATLLYYGKYHQDHLSTIYFTAERLALLAKYAREFPVNHTKKWRETLLGIEGEAARHYWQCLHEIGLLAERFPGRIGRQAKDDTNMALNYGYAILTCYVWNAILNAGLEPYAGVYHTPRPGKPSLVLDIMEEYRAWVVDRAVIKQRSLLGSKNSLDINIRKRVIAEIHKTFATHYPFRKRKMRLESILQRQVYHIPGAFMDEEKRYRPYTFKW